MGENDEYIGIFLTESREHIDALNNALVTLEKNPNDIRSINEAFRTFHTLKGNSATMGYENFSTIAHKLEDLLDMIRNKKLAVNKEIMDVLFMGCDILDAGLDKIENGDQKAIDPTEIIERLEKINPSKTKENNPDPEMSDTVAFSKKEEMLIKKLKLDRQAIKRIIIVFEDHVLKTAKALTLIKKINDDDSNKVIRINPEEKLIKQGKFGVKLEVILSTEKIDEIKKSIETVSKIESVHVLGIEQSLGSHEKEFNKSKIISDHKEEIKKVQDVRIDITKLDNLMDMVGELLIYKMNLENLNKEIKSKELEGIANSISLLTQNIQNEVIDERMIPLGSVFSRLPRIVRDLSYEEGKEIEFQMEGEENKLDRSVIDKITDPLIHVVRNSVDHGIESPQERMKAGKERKGVIKLSAAREKNKVIISIDDDGAGINVPAIRKTALEKGLYSTEELDNMGKEELLKLVFMPGFSTSEKVTSVSGRGVGMDVVETNVKQAGGRVLLSSDEGKGTTVTLELPLTMAIITVLIVSAKNEKYAIPLNNILETLQISKEEIKSFQNNETFILRGEDIPLLRLGRLVGSDVPDSKSLTVVMVETNNKKFGLVVDSIDTEQDILLKDIDENLKKVKGIAGGTILGDGRVCFIVDLDTLIV